MKNKVLSIVKYTGCILGIIMILSLLFYFFAARKVDERINRNYDFEGESISFKTSPAIIEKGRHIAYIRGCITCHGGDLSGKVFIDEPGVGIIYASNLTIGKGGVGNNYTDMDWYNALRHGIKKNKKPLLFMPSTESAEMSMEDIEAIVAFCKNQRAKHNILPASTIGPVTKVLTYLEKMPLLSVEKINHRNKVTINASKKVGIAQGKYLSSSCTGCHTQTLKGGPAILPGMPPIPDITTSGTLSHTSLNDFKRILKTGKLPNGRQINNEEMPWKMTAKYSNAEIESLYKYLKSL